VLEPTPPQVTAALLDPGLGAITVGIEDVADGQQVTIGIPDRPGVFSLCAGVLALNQLDVRAAKVATIDDRGTAVFAVRPRFGRAPVPQILADGVRAALDGSLPVAARLRQREADYREDATRSAPPRISWHDAEVSGDDAAIVEVRAADRAGLLHRLTSALAAEGLDVTSARVETLGGDAVDSFYVCTPSGTPLDAAQRRRIERALIAAATGAEQVPAGVPGDTPG
jgi:[protein-PII] uridylyltransferase